VNGIKFELDLREVIDASLYYSGTFEEDSEKAIASLVGPGMTVLDIGANIGYHTFALARLVGPQGLVVAIEPTAHAFAKLTRNASLNAFGNIRCLNLGLGDRDLGVVDAGFQSSYRLDGKDTVEQERIEIETLDSVVDREKLARLDFIKMDVDGYEGKVFTGAERTLARFQPRILFEFCPAGMRHVGDDPEKLLGQIEAAGYLLRDEHGRTITDPRHFHAQIPNGNSANLVAIPAQDKRPYP
jgi:FkbM family methyltransferase